MPLAKYIIVFIALVYGVLCITAFKNFNGGSFLSNSLFYPVAILIGLLFLLILGIIGGVQYYLHKAVLFQQYRDGLIISGIIFMVCHFLIVFDVWHQWEMQQNDIEFKANFQEELNRLNKEIQQNPADFRLYYRHGKLIQTNSREYDYTVAKADFEKAWQLNPEDYQTNLELSQFYAETEETGKKYYRKINAFVSDSLNKRIQNDTNDVSAYLDRAALREKEGKTEMAIKDYETALQFDEKLYTAAFKLGDLYFNAGNVIKSDTYYLQGTLHNGVFTNEKDTTFQVLMQKAFCKRYNLLNLEAALADYLAAYKIYPKDAEITREIGLIYEQLGNKPEADKFRKINP